MTANDGPGRLSSRMPLEISSVVHSFGDRSALDSVSMDVAPGVLTGLLGPNGAGKTTLLRILLGVLVADGGGLRWGGRPIAAKDRQGWGYAATDLRA
jgi:ABC-2 type transport system ATP-binding protein